MWCVLGGLLNHSIDGFTGSPTSVSARLLQLFLLGSSWKKGSSSMNCICLSVSGRERSW